MNIIIVEGFKTISDAEDETLDNRL